MWAETLPNGKVRFAERYKDPLTGKNKRVSVTMDKNTASTRKAALDALNAKIVGKLNGASRAQENLTLGKLKELYLEHEKDTCKPGTYRCNKFKQKKIVELLGADSLVSGLTAGYVRDRFSTEKSCTYNGYVTYFKAMIRWGYENDYIADIRFIDKIKKREDNEKRSRLESKYLEKEELSLLIDSIASERWKMMIKFLVLSGLRFGEAAGLDVEDVDLESSTIFVHKNYDSSEKVITSPKTHSSTREVYIQPELENVCLEINEYYKDLQEETGIFFPNNDGGRIQYSAFKNYVADNSAGLIEKKITPHIFRHTHVSLLAEAGVQLEVISRRLGHSNSKITRDIYLHVTNRMKEKDRERLKDIRILS